MRVVPVAVCNSSTSTIGFIVATEESDPFSYKYSQYSLSVFVLAAQVIPLIAMIVLNSWLIFILKSSKLSWSHRTMSCSSRKHDQQVTIIVVAIIASFLLFNIPSAIVWAVHLSNGLGKMPKIFFTIAEIANIFVATGKATNFFVYYCCSEQFRQRLRGIFVSKFLGL